MKLAAVFFMLSVLGCCAAQEPKTNQPAGVSFPTPISPTIPHDALFALGQQSGKIDAIAERLNRIEQDVKDISKDVFWMRTIMLIVGGALTLIIAPIIVAQVNRWIEKKQPAKAA